MSFQSRVETFQRREGLVVDGTVGDSTWSALEEAFLPSKPAFGPLTDGEKLKLFGDPMGGEVGKDGRFTPSTTFKQRLVKVEVPTWFSKAPVVVHMLVGASLTRLLTAWENAGVHALVRSFDGSLAFRLVRGGTTVSSHAYGIAFDINAAWNPLGAMPALPWENGTLLELVKIANACGWYWGGHFSRRDGMHWEAARI
jgi:hypothetical protein